MNEVTLSSTAVPERARSTAAFYRLVWKWHFLAALYVLPFMLLLALTGAIYLYKPQIESLIYADRMTVEQSESRVEYEAQIKSVKTLKGLNRLRGVTVYEDPSRSTLVEFDDADKVRSYAWVNPYDGKVLATIPRKETLMRMVKNFHGELLLGDVGTKFVELAAHWAIVMFITGLYLWWPRGGRTFSAAFRPPSGNGRSWWRETHLFTGFLAALLVVPILITGLPWTDVWGGGLSYIQKQTNQSSKSLRFGGNTPGSTSDTGEPISFAAVFDIASQEGLAMPYEMRPSKNEAAAYWIRSANKNRQKQTELIVDQYSGEVLARVDFADNPPVAKAVSYGISFHQGELYGWLNVLQNTLAALLAIVLAVSGFVAWWMRRPAGSLGVPAAPSNSLSVGMLVLIVVLACLLPLMGLSLIFALLMDRLVFSRFGWFED